MYSLTIVQVTDCQFELVLTVSYHGPRPPPRRGRGGQNAPPSADPGRSALGRASLAHMPKAAAVTCAIAPPHASQRATCAHLELDRGRCD